ncbi:MAG: DUF1565 domain-containing protein, partial [Bacteroidota bacterium]|nr:DUF1565 domain-containing protein [Bacteroidota bacterium]
MKKALLSFFLSLILLNLYAKKWYVNDNSTTGDIYSSAIGNDLNSGSSLAPFATVNKAITSASNNDTIYVDSGVYTEQIIINAKILNIIGAGKTKSTLKCPANPSNTVTNCGKPIIGISNVSSVVIDGFTIDGLSLMSTINSLNGVGFNDAGGTVRNCAFQNIDGTTSSVGRNGCGITGQLVNTARSITITNNTFTNFITRGINLSSFILSAPITINIYGNTIAGSGYRINSNSNVQRGITITGVFNGSVNNNTISNMAHESLVSYGIRIYGGQSVSGASLIVDTKNNTITNVERAIEYIATVTASPYTCNLSGAISENIISVSQSAITQSVIYGISVWQRAVGVMNVNVNNNSVSGNILQGYTGSQAIRLLSSIDSTKNQRILNINMRGNSIVKSSGGVKGWSTGMYGETYKCNLMTLNIDSNSVFDCRKGIQIVNSQDDIQTNKLITSIKNNLLTNNDTGIVAYGYTLGSKAVNNNSSLTATITNNSISGGNYRLKYLSSKLNGATGMIPVSVNAPLNWWGQSNEPNNVITNSDSVGYSPWLYSGTNTISSPAFSGNYASLGVSRGGKTTFSGERIKDALNQLSGSALSLYINPGTYPETDTVAKDITFYGISNPAIQSLVMNGSGKTLSLGGSITISNTLTMYKGKIDIGKNNLTLASGATINGNPGNSSYIITSDSGSLVKNNITVSYSLFPVGTLTGYSPVTISNSGTPDNFSVRVNNPPNPSLPSEMMSNFVNLSWVISEAVTGGSNATIYFGWQPADQIGSLSLSNTKLMRYTNAWSIGNSLDSLSAYNAKVSGITDFAANHPFAIYEPHFISSDTSTCNGKQITLTAKLNGYYQWSTGSRNKSITVNPTTTTTYKVTIRTSVLNSSLEQYVVAVKTVVADAGPDRTVCK